MAPNGYIVVFRDGVDGHAETARLASVYGFTPKYVYTILNGFAATLDLSVVDRLRCETSVASIAYDGEVSLY